MIIINKMEFIMTSDNIYDEYYQNKDFDNIMDRYIIVISNDDKRLQMTMDKAIDFKDYNAIFKLIKKRCIITPEQIDNMIHNSSIYCRNKHEFYEEFITILKICKNANIKISDYTMDTIKASKDEDIYKKILSLNIKQINNCQI